MKLILIIAIIASFALPSWAQQKETAPQPQERTPVNQVDARGKKHGLWWISVPPRMGESGISEFGSYDHGSKLGAWYKVDHEGDLVAIESFRNNVLDGEVKYYDRGLLYCTGQYRGLNARQKFDTIMVMHPVTHEESYRIIPTENGTMRHGTWRYFNPRNGHLIREEEYQVDELVFKKDYEVSSGLDSLYRQQHAERLPHNKGAKYQPPAGKRLSYTDN